MHKHAAVRFFFVLWFVVCLCFFL